MELETRIGFISDLDKNSPLKSAEIGRKKNPQIFTSKGDSGSPQNSLKNAKEQQIPCW